MKPRTLILISTLLLLAGILAGCGTTTTPTSTPRPIPRPATPQGTAMLTTSVPAPATPPTVTATPAPSAPAPVTPSIVTATSASAVPSPTAALVALAQTSPSSQCALRENDGLHVVSLRSGPNAGFNTMVVVGRKDTLIPVAQIPEGEWLLVQFASFATGWVEASLLTCTFTVPLPVVTLLPSATPSATISATATPVKPVQRLRTATSPELLLQPQPTAATGIRPVQPQRTATRLELLLQDMPMPFGPISTPPAPATGPAPRPTVGSRP